MSRIVLPVKKLTILILLIVSFVCMNIGSVKGAGTDETAALKQAADIMALLKSRQFEAVDALASPTLRNAIKQMGADGFKYFWPMLESQIGVLTGYDEPYVSTAVPQGTTVIVPSTFDGIVYDGYLTLNSSLLLEGYVIRPHVGRNIKGPEYVDETKFEEHTVSVGTPAYPLPGSLTLPKGLDRYPVVLMLAGSGPSDKDETIGPNKPFRDIAHGLATNGIASLRFDKRTKVYSEMPRAEQTIIDWEYLEDARACIDLLAKMPQVSNIYILGHSLGAQIAPEIARERPNVAGVICLGGPATPLEELMLYQYKYLASLGLADSSTVEKYQKELESYRNAPNSPEGILAGTPFRYFHEIKALGEPPMIAKGISQPLLLAFGARDYQVPPSEMEIWKNALSGRINTDIELYEGLNHLFIKGQGTPNPDEYNIPANVDKTVINDITNWIKKH